MQHTPENPTGKPTDATIKACLIAFEDLGLTPGQVEAVAGGIPVHSWTNFTVQFLRFRYAPMRLKYQRGDGEPRDLRNAPDAGAEQGSLI